MPNPKFIQIQTTTDSEDNAGVIARYLIENQLAACVQILPSVQSHYRWEGELVTSQEWLLLIKTTRAKYPEVEQALYNLHHYQLPEIIALPIVKGSAAYLNWLDSECQ